MNPTPGWVVDRQHQVLVVLLVALSCAYTVMPSGFQYKFILDASTVEDGVGPWFKVQWVPLFAIAFFLILRRFVLFTMLGPHINPFAAAIIAWMLLSCAVADDPAHSFRQAIITAGVVVVTLAHTLVSWRTEQLQVVVRWTYTLLCIASLIVALALPEIGVHQSENYELKNSWRGVCQAKYFLGHVAQISALLWGYLWITGQARSWPALAGIALSVLLLIKSRSNTSLIVLLIGLSLIFVILRPPLRLRQTAPAVRIALVLSLFVPAFVYLLFIGEVSYRNVMEPVAGYFGKDITISGRTPIWEELWRVIHLNAKHYWIGVGYMGFWRGPGSLADETLRTLGWPCPDGHNGYLDIWNQLGLIGILLLAGYLLFHAHQIRRVARIEPQTAALHLAILIMVMIENLTSSAFFRPIAPPFLLLSYSSMTLARVLLEQRLQAAASMRHRTFSAAPPVAPAR